MRARGLSVALLLIAGCGLETRAVVPGTVDGSPGVDAGRADGGVEGDGGANADAGAMDAGAIDAGTSDAGTPDGGCDPGSIDPSVAIALPARSAVVVDGDLGEFASAVFFDIESSTFVGGGGAPGSAADLSARFAFLYDSDALYLGIEVTDDTQTNASDGALIWDGDCVQIGFDMASNGGATYDATDDFEFGWALTSGGLRRYRWVAPAPVGATAEEYAVVRSGVRTIYEVRFTASELGGAGFAVAMHARTSLLVNESDADAREGYLEWGSGVGATKNPSLFRDLELRGCR